MRTRTAIEATAVTAVVTMVSGTAAAHVGGLSGSYSSGTVPMWLTVTTGGVIIGASFLFTSLLTDHEAIRLLTGWGVTLPTPASIGRIVRVTVRGMAVGGLVLVLVAGVVGPAQPTRNFAILVVWAGWWAGFTMSVYLVGNAWPLVNPWQAIVAVLDRLEIAVGRSDYPERFGAWPAVVGLLALVWVEVVTPAAADPRLLVGLILMYSVVTIGGALTYGSETWFEVVDPVARVFRMYGWLAPLQWREGRIEVRLPTTALTEQQLPNRPGETPFVVALLWVTTYDGLVATPTWTSIVVPVVEAGVPALVVYGITILGGFGAFLLIYRLAARKARQTAGTYVEESFIEHYFAPSLLPIAAGYHLAHFLGYFITLSPALAAVILSPLAGTTNPQVVVLPDAFGILPLLVVLTGHILAILVAHAVSFDLFPGILKPLRSQYPFVVVMIFYTITSMWVIIQPFTPPPFV